MSRDLHCCDVLQLIFQQVTALLHMFRPLLCQHVASALLRERLQRQRYFLLQFVRVEHLQNVCEYLHGLLKALRDTRSQQCRGARICHSSIFSAHTDHPLNAPFSLLNKTTFLNGNTLETRFARPKDSPDHSLYFQIVPPLPSSSKTPAASSSLRIRSASA